MTTLRAWYYVHDKEIDSPITRIEFKDFKGTWDEWRDGLVITNHVVPFMVQVLP